MTRNTTKALWTWIKRLLRIEKPKMFMGGIGPDLYERLKEADRRYREINK